MIKREDYLWWGDLPSLPPLLARMREFRLQKILRLDVESDRIWRLSKKPKRRIR